MIKREDCKCECHNPEKNFAHSKKCCEYEELGVDRFVLTAPFGTGPFVGMLLETDEARPYAGTHEWLQPTYDCRDLVVRRLHVNLEPHLEKMRQAVNRINMMGLRPERITILKGEVQAHPEFRDHYRCPFCYPEMQRAIKTHENRYEV